MALVLDNNLNFKIYDNKIILQCFLGLILLSSLDVAFDSLRYIKYLVLPIALLLLLIAKPMLHSVHKAFLVFLLLTFASLPFSTEEGVKDYIFIMAYTLPFLFIDKTYVSAPRVFIIVALVFSLSVMLTGQKNFSFSIADSKSSFENHTFAFVFGLFAVYFLITKRLLYFLFALILCILVLKRISIVAIFICSLLCYLPKRTVDSILKWPLILTVNVVGIVLCYFITTDSFNEYTNDLFGMSAAYLTMGRSVLYGEIFNHTNEWSYLFGNGFGSSYQALASVAWLDKVHLHNDILKILYENGLIVLVAFITQLYRGSLSNKIFAVYLNIIFFTDNVFVYTFVMFFFMFLSLKLQERNV